MMQQPVYQQEHQGAQDQGQQMVLCPVRLVYETQMLVQPGEQIQPNQTILINHQNTPPWIQNRQVQNQVIYVQHVPTNYIPSHQQHIDQNQLYIQNYGYQNVPQMFVQNPQEQIRPMQMQMMPNMVQNMQTLPTNINAIQNQRMISNVAPVQQQVNIVNTPNQNNTINRLIAPSHINQNEVINKPQELHTQSIFRHQMPQTVQQEHRFPIQPTITMVPNNVQSIQRVPQAYDSNVSQIRPVHQNIAPNIQQAYPNTIFNVDDTKKVNSVNTTANKGTNVTSFNIVNPNNTSKSLPQTYRPIQPRTNQVRNNTPNLHPMQTSVGIQAQHTMPNIISMNNVPRKIMPNSSTLVSNVNTTLSNIKVESNNFLFNRKRKSESPDEVHKKVANNNQTEAPIVIKQIQNEAYNMNNSADVGVNTSPIHRPSGRITINNMQITPLNPNAHNSKLIEELAKPVRNQAQNTQVTEAQNVVRNTVSVMPENVADMVPSDKEKLVRNTVYVQARGRILTDKDNIPEPPKVETPVCNPEPKLTLPTVKPKIETIVKNPEPNISMPVLNEKQSETSQEISQLKPEIKTELINAEVKQSATHEVKPLAKVQIKQPPKVEVIPPVEVKPPAKVEVIPPAKIEVKLPVKLEVKSPTKAEIKTPTKVEVKSSAKVEVKPPVKIEVKPPAKTELKPPAKVELKPPAKAEVKTPAKVENNKSKTKLELKQEKSGNTSVEPSKKEVVKMDTESVPDVKPKEEIPTEVKEDRGFILTHVLGGFVIQESNIAFPIRKPLKEKTLFNNTEDLKNDAKDMKREFVKDNSKILDISHLNIKECESMVADTDESQTSDDKENPFSQLKPSEVRTWTAEQLATHLAKYNWTETVSVLQDHELDGESLLLVSKAQLVTIGVKEEHAEAICEFVKS